MRLGALVTITAALVIPSVGQAQHSHGGGGMDMPPRQEKGALPVEERQRGVLLPGSPRQVEVLVLSWGFSPREIRADQGEQVVLAVRRSSDDSHCKAGLTISAKHVHVQLPVGETIPVTLRLEQAETFAIGCEGEEDVQASVVVAPR
jgi:hypothetical protein